jgi:hypothetical protein
MSLKVSPPPQNENIKSPRERQMADLLADVGGGLRMGIIPYWNLEY